MKKVSAVLLILFTMSIIIFGTWQLYLGHLEAAFSSFPFLLITYFFVKQWQK